MFTSVLAQLKFFFYWKTLLTVPNCESQGRISEYNSVDYVRLDTLILPVNDRYTRKAKVWPIQLVAITSSKI